MIDFRTLIVKDDLDICGWCFDDKRNFIKQFILELNRPVTCVEIGVFKGCSLLCFAEFLREYKGGTVTGIDPWSVIKLKNNVYDEKLQHYIFEELMKDQSTFDKVYDDLVKLLEDNQLTDTVKLIRDPSEFAFLNFDLESIDVLHIDGNHDEINVSRDILLYLPLVKKGGYIIMDDCNWPGVSKAIERYLNPFVFNTFKNNSFACYKKL